MDPRNHTNKHETSMFLLIRLRLVAN